MKVRERGGPPPPATAPKRENTVQCRAEGGKVCGRLEFGLLRIMLASSWLLTTGIVWRPHLSTCSHAARGSHVAMASGLLTGEAVPEAVLSELGIVGQRAVVAFYCRDSGFEDRKQLQDFQDRAAAFEKLACEIVAVRGNKRDAAVDGTEAKFPALRFLVDEDDALRQALRMDVGGLRGGDRHTYVVDTAGRVQGQINNYADPFVHAQMARRTLTAMDKDGWDAASSVVDKKAAREWEIYNKEMAETKKRAEELEAKLSAQREAAETGAEPPPAGSFLSGIFGAFNKDK